MATRVRKPKSNREPSDEAVLSRARRLAKKQMTPMLEALGLTADASQEQIQEALSGLTKARQENMGAVERAEEKLRQAEAKLEEEKALRKEAEAKASGLESQVEELQGELEYMQADFTFRSAARKLGVVDEDYAMELLKRKLNSMPDDAEIEDDFAEQFFQGLKEDKSKSYLFGEVETPAGPSPASNQDAIDSGGTPPGDGNPAPENQPDPNPSPAGKPEPEEDVSELDRRAFNRRTYQKYGYRPGTF